MDDKLSGLMEIESKPIEGDLSDFLDGDWIEIDGNSPEDRNHVTDEIHTGYHVNGAFYVENGDVLKNAKRIIRTFKGSDGNPYPFSVLIRYNLLLEDGYAVHIYIRDKYSNRERAEDRLDEIISLLKATATTHYVPTAIPPINY